MTLRLNGSNSGFTEVKAPATAGSNTITLPTSNGSANQFLMNSGTAGELEFASLASSDMPTGSILQVVSTTKTDVYSESFTTAGEGGGITGFTVSITPSSTSNKVLLTGFMSVGTDNAAEHQVSYRIYRGSTVISVGDADSNSGRVTGGANFGDANNRSPAVMAINFLDSPSTTSSVTYSIRLYQLYSTTITLYLNRGGDTTDVNSRVRATSTITAMEVAA